MPVTTATDPDSTSATSATTSPARPARGTLPAREVACSLSLRADGPATLALQIAAATSAPIQTETLTVTVDGQPAAVRELPSACGGRMHVVEVDAGDIAVTYRARVGAPTSPPTEPAEEELLVATRPSRFVDSDVLAATAAAEFGTLAGLPLLEAITTWVGHRLSYVIGSSKPIDAASDTLLAGAGVCRDYAHVVAGLARARNLPARVVGVYAPGLDPMDFHAVAEVWAEGAWRVADATGLAPRRALVRVATGRDTADTAFLTTTGPVTLLGQEILAIVDGDLPLDDASPVTLA